MKNLFILSILLIAVTFGGCGSAEHKTDEVQIGVILPLTGELASYGKKIKNGILLYGEQYNLKSKIKLKFLVEDDKGETNSTVGAFQKLTNIDGVKIVIGTLTSGGTLAIAPLAQKNNVLLMSPTASATALTGAGSMVYRVWASDDLDGIISAEYCYNNLKLRKMGISFQNNDYCLGLKTIFEKRFKELGGQIVQTSGYNEGENDFRAFISRLKSFGCDGVYLPGHPIGISSFLKQSKELGFSSTNVANVAAEDQNFLKLAGSASNGLYYTTPAADLGSSDPLIKSFVKDYSIAYKETPDIFGIKGYESIQVIAGGLTSSKVNPADVAGFIDKKKKFELIEGDVVFDKNGDISTAVSVKQYKDLKSAIIETIKPK